MSVERCYLYRFFDADDRLLYVGITRDIHARMAAHRRTAHWWNEISHAQWQVVVSRAEAMSREAFAIAGEGPLHNAMRPTLKVTSHVSREQLRLVAEVERLRRDAGAALIERVTLEARALKAERELESALAVIELQKDLASYRGSGSPEIGGAV
jgi:predicted GIY-YIG superfamily endonuclease